MIKNYRFKLHKDHRDMMQKCCQICLDSIDDWEFPSFIGVNKPFIIALIAKLGGFTYKNIAFLSPDDVFVSLNEDELTALFYCLCNATSNQHDPINNAMLLGQKACLNAAKESLNDILMRNDIAL